jgi:tRNA-specific adenosine deaminase 3
VFATRPIRAGTVLEEAPVLVLTQDEWENGRMNDSVLGEYGFCWSAGGMALGLGIGEWE